MRLADQIAQCRTSLGALDVASGARTRLSGAGDFADEIALCPARYVLSDDLARLCTALAYSRGARAMACADLLHVPLQRVWVEWCSAACDDELGHYGFHRRAGEAARCGRRGALLRASADGRRGWIRTFWALAEAPSDLLASSMEAYFDLDTAADDEPEAPGLQDWPAARVHDCAGGEPDVLNRCFRFRFERSWAEYYRRASLSVAQQAAVTQHALATIAIDVPVLLAFFLLLATRTGLPQRPQCMERLNRSRLRAGKRPLLDHIEIRSPLSSGYQMKSEQASFSGRRRPRLHHVRGHLVRRGSEVFWRVPHLRGNARSGTVRCRTVTWSFDRPAAARVPGATTRQLATRGASG
jgi:hypothetical protein